MNTIILGSGVNQRTFTDSTILQGNIFVSNSPIGESLETDEFNFTVLADNFDYESYAPKGYDLIKTVDNKVFVTNKTYQQKMTLTPYGTQVVVQHDSQTIGKFFVRKITQQAVDKFYVESISAVGLLSYIDHYGGVYGVDAPTYVTDLIEDIIGDMPCTISSVFNTMMIQGYLPKASARDNLQQVLFAVGGAVLKDTSGNLEIKYNQPESATVLPDSSIYNGAEIKNLTKATKVTLTEHAYFKGETTTAQDLFDNLDDITTVVGQEIIFNEPYYDYHAYNASGVEIPSFIISSGVNYVVIGTNELTKGRITGKPYVHSQRTLVKSTGVTSIEANEITVSDATLVSPYNSSNCLERLASYYSEANEVDMDIVYGTERSGTLLQFSNFYGGNDNVGYVKSLDINLSNTLKANSKLAVDWTPNHLGNTYNAYTIIDSAKLGGLSGNWIPQDDNGNSLIGKEAYVVMFSGAQGGQGGYNGANGTGAGSSANLKSYRYNIGTNDRYQCYEPSTAGQGGNGGNGGNGGSRCSRYNSTILTLGSSYNVSLGAGGAGGSANGGAGQSGGHTTFGTYSSNEHDLTGSYVNIIDQSIYCENGSNGIKGGNGGNGGTVSMQTASPYANNGTNGGNAGQKQGGSATNGSIIQCHNNDTGENLLTWYLNVGGGGGGGASADNNGTTAGNTVGVNVAWYSGGSYVWILETDRGGNGGNGASATVQPTQTTLGCGGSGGNGGGGGGGAGAGCSNNPLPSIFDGDKVLPAVGGNGGTGSQGGQGSNGFIVVYYHA